MQSFWLGTWAGDPRIGPLCETSQSIAAGAAGPWAIEVLKDGDLYVVLISAADALDNPGTLQCLIGFANGAKACSLWRSHGFPLIEATIRYDNETLEVLSPFFGDPTEMTEMQYGKSLLEIDGVRFKSFPGSGLTVASSYEQSQDAPEPWKAAKSVLRKPVQWLMVRSDGAEVVAVPLEIRAASSRFPCLFPIATGRLPIAHAWSGLCKEPQIAALPGAAPVTRGAVFGTAKFRFQDIEVVGFRVRLEEGPKLDAGLRDWILPLNNALGPEGGFGFEVATPVILVELLRYGRMQQDGPPMRAMRETDYQSQHELVVRLQVGKVDAGQTRPHDLAVHVPAIFVDNPWSKVVGRDLQGFEKCLADFCVREENDHLRLRPDGRLEPDGAKRALSDITQINLVDVLSSDPISRGPTLLDIECPGGEDDKWLTFSGRDFMNFVRPRVWPRWRRSDFDDKMWVNFLGADTIWYSLSRFHSIQSTPVDDRGLDKALISAACDLSDLKFVNPTEGAKLTFRASDAAPHGWQTLCRLIGAAPEKACPIQRLDWYRLKFSMDLATLDGLYPSDPRH